MVVKNKIYVACFHGIVSSHSRGPPRHPGDSGAADGGRRHSRLCRDSVCFLILEQLMVDAVIRVSAEIRFAFPHSFILAIISRKSSPKSKPSVRSSPPSLSSSAHPADRHDVSRCLHASSRPSLGLRAGIRGLQSGFRLAERQFGGAGADGGRLHVRSR